MIFRFPGLRTRPPLNAPSCCAMARRWRVILIPQRLAPRSWDANRECPMNGAAALRPVGIERIGKLVDHGPQSNCFARVALAGL